MGFDRVFYTFGNWRPGAESNFVAHSTIAPQWAIEHHKTLSPESDPMLAHGCNSFQPLKMGLDYPGARADMPTAHRRFIDRVASAGFRSTAAFPVRLRGEVPFGGWVLSADNWRQPQFDSLFEAHGEIARVAAFFAHERLWTDKPKTAVVLTVREADCLLWLGHGLHIGEVADRFGVSRATVEFHLRNARAKLGARTREEALAKAILRRLICP